MELSVGSTLYCNFGAMYPTYETTVVSIEGNIVHYTNLLGETCTVNLDSIKPYGYISENGSAIGVFLKPIVLH